MGYDFSIGRRTSGVLYGGGTFLGGCLEGVDLGEKIKS
jgi:hypothetical protein